MSRLASHLQAVFGPIRFREILKRALLLLRFRKIGSSRIWPESGRQKKLFNLKRVHHSTFASFANKDGIRSVTKSPVMSNPYAIHSLSGELSRRHRSPLRFIVFACYAVAITAAFGGIVRSVRADLEVFRADGLAALIGGSVPGPRVDIVLRSDVELRARLRLSGQASGPVSTGPLPQSLFDASLNEIVGEYLIAREAVRLRITKPTEAKVADEKRRIEQIAGGRDRLKALLEALSVSQDEIDEIARRRALVAAFLSLNTAGATFISDAQIEKAVERSDNRLNNEDTIVANDVFRARLARDAIDQTVARWIKVLRARTPVYVFRD